MDHVQENTLDPPNNVDFAFDRMEEFFQRLQVFYQWLSRSLRLKDHQKTAQKYLSDHPVLCIFIGVAMVMCSVPVFFFFIFAVSTAFILLLGFLLVEGTFLACGFLVLLAAMFIAACLSVGCSILILSIYYASLFVRHFTANVKYRLLQPDVDCHVE